MSPLFIIALSTLKRSIRSRSFFVLGFVAPFLIMAALSVTIGAALAGEFRPALVIVDPSGGPMSEPLLANLRDAGFDDLQVVSETQANEAVEQGEADVAIVLPAGLYDPTADQQPVRIVVDGQSAIASDTAESIAEQVSTSAATTRALAVVGGESSSQIAPVTVAASANVGSSVLTDATYFAVGMSSFFTTFAAVGFMAGYHQDRRQSTLARMLVAPIARLTPIGGKALGVLAVISVSLLSLILASTVLLGADWGAPFGVAAIGGALAFMAVSVATCVVAMTETEASASQVGMILATAWAVFGGVFVEIPSSGPLAYASRLSPFTWAINGVGENAGTGTPTEVLIHAAAIAFFGVVALAVAVIRRAEIARP